MKQHPETFKDWMRSKGAWNNYLKAFAKQKPDAIIWDFVEKNLKARTPHRCIGAAFTWDSTPQGYGYWMSLKNEWAEYWKQLDEDSVPEIKTEVKPDNSLFEL